MVVLDFCLSYNQYNWKENEYSIGNEYYIRLAYNIIIMIQIVHNHVKNFKALG